MEPLNMQYAPTTNPGRPRALAIGWVEYDVDIDDDEQRDLLGLGDLYILFRKATENSPALWVYHNVPKEAWTSLKNSDSTGNWLRIFDYDNWDDKEPVLDGQVSLSKEHIQAKRTQESQRKVEMGETTLTQKEYYKQKFGKTTEGVEFLQDNDKVAAWYAYHNPEKGRELGIL